MEEDFIKKLLSVFLCMSTLVLCIQFSSVFAEDESSTEECTIVTKNMETGEEKYTTLEIDDNCQIDTSSFVPEDTIEYTDSVTDVMPTGVTTDDTRTEILSKSNCPYKAICKVVATWYGEGSNGSNVVSLRVQDSWLAKRLC